MATITEEQRQLTAKLRKAADDYYQKGQSSLTDADYDKQLEELKALETASGASLATSPTHAVGANATSRLKIHHEYPALSLDKSHDPSTIARKLRDANQEAELSLKLDGMTLVATYDNGRLTSLVTRGDGKEGDDLTAAAPLVEELPTEVPINGHMVVRGEAVMSFAEFDRIREREGDESYANPRNLAAGTISKAIRDSPDVLKERAIRFVAFELVGANGTSPNLYGNEPESLTWDVSFDTRTGLDCNLFSSRLDLLEAFGFTVVERELVRDVTDENMESALARWTEKAKNNELPCDGVVVQMQRVSEARALGTTGHHPRSGIAYKWANTQKETTIREIEWSASRTGRLNPVAIFDAVELDGTSVRRASVHNVSCIKELGLNIGDTVLVSKSNLIIPQVDENLTRSLEDIADVLPSACPVCGEAVSIHAENGSEVLHCDNPDCAAKHTGRIAYAFTNKALDAKGLAESRIAQLIEAGIVSSVADMFSLADKRNRVVNVIEKWQDASFDAACAAIESARHTDAAHALVSFGIPEIGSSASRDICAAYANDLPALIADVREGKLDRVLAVEGIGEKMAANLKAYVDAHADEMLKLIGILDIADAGKAPEKATDGWLVGKKVAFTGKVNGFKNRTEFKAFVEERGGKLVGSVSRACDVLVTNTPDSNSSKNQNARKLDIPIMTEDEFVAMAG
jgi:DNA ligase (NAD+)